MPNIKPVDTHAGPSQLAVGSRSCSPPSPPLLRGVTRQPVCCVLAHVGSGEEGPASPDMTDDMAREQGAKERPGGLESRVTEPDIRGRGQYYRVILGGETSWPILAGEQRASGSGPQMYRGFFIPGSHPVRNRGPDSRRALSSLSRLLW